MVVLDGVSIDREAARAFVVFVEPFEVAEAEYAGAHSEARQIHHRIADVTDLEIDDRLHAPPAVHELARVPHDYTLSCMMADRVALQPGETEFETGVGPLLGGAIGPLVDLNPEATGIGRSLCAQDAGLDEGLHVEPMNPREDLHVVVHHRIALGLFTALEMFGARDAVHHVGPRIVAPAPDPGDGNARIVKPLLELHLVFEGKAVTRVDAIASHTERKSLAVAFDFGEPDRPPARLRLDAGQHAADIRLEPADDLFRAVFGAVSFAVKGVGRRRIFRHGLGSRS